MGVEMEMCGNPRATRTAVTLTLTRIICDARTTKSTTTTTAGVRATERSAEQGRSERPPGRSESSTAIFGFSFRLSSQRYCTSVISASARLDVIVVVNVDHGAVSLSLA